MSAFGADKASADFLAQTGNQHLHGIAVVRKILAINMLRQFPLANNAALLVHEIAERPIFELRQAEHAAIEGRILLFRVEDTPSIASVDVAFPDARRMMERNRASSSSMWKGLAR